MINHLLLRRNEELWYRGLVLRMTERAQIVYYSARVVARSDSGRKPPNKVRTGGRDEGGGAGMPVGSHTPLYMERLGMTI